VQTTSGTWHTHAGRYPNLAHNAISAALGVANGPRYACYFEDPRSEPPDLAAPPAGTTAIREALLFPEGPLEWTEERPDSSTNDFCLGCHHDLGRLGFGLDALEPGAPGVNLLNDTRRQPLMPPRVMFGNIPAFLIGSGPATDLSTGDHGIDRYTFPDLP
jgi:hypothetical protein